MNIENNINVDPTMFKLCKNENKILFEEKKIRE